MTQVSPISLIVNSSFVNRFHFHKLISTTEPLLVGPLFLLDPSVPAFAIVDENGINYKAGCVIMLNTEGFL